MRSHLYAYNTHTIHMLSTMFNKSISFIRNQIWPIRPCRHMDSLVYFTTITSVSYTIHGQCYTMNQHSLNLNICCKQQYHQFIKCRKISGISCTKSQNLHVSRLVLQLSLPKPLKPGVKSSMNDHSDVVGASPVSAAPTTSEWSTILLHTKVQLILEVLR